MPAIKVRIAIIAATATLIASAALADGAAAKPSRRADIVPSSSGHVGPSDWGTARPAARAEASDPVAPSRAAQARVVRPYLSAFDAHAYDAAKTHAQADPEAGAQAPMQPVVASTVVSSFEGLDQTAGTSAGSDFAPPDTVVAKSPNHILEGANSAVRLLGNDGSTVQTSDLNTFFGAPHDAANGGLDLLFDPRVYYDASAKNPRFFVAATQVYGNSDANGVSVLWIAVSRSSDPASLGVSDWCTYDVDTKWQAGTSKSSWMDYPQIGTGKDALLISGNGFRFSDNSFTYSLVNAFDKRMLEDNAKGKCPKVPYFTFQPSSKTTDPKVFSLAPVQSFTPPKSYRDVRSPAYLLSTEASLDATTAVRVWRIRGVGKGAPTMAWKDLEEPVSFTIPPGADQPDATGVLLETGDARVLSAVGKNNSLSAVLTTGCQQGSGALESCMFYTKIKIKHPRKGRLRAVMKAGSVRGEGDGRFVFYPSIAVNEASQLAAAAQISSANGLDPSANYLGYILYTRNRDATDWTTVVSTPGACVLPADDPGGASLARTGDYTGVATDPSDGATFWAGAEFTKFNGPACDWSTTVAHITP